MPPVVEVRIVVTVADPAWRALDRPATLCRRVLTRACRYLEPTPRRRCEISVLLTDDSAMRALNAKWRGIDRPTDVLSFPQHADAIDLISAEPDGDPAEEAVVLGDIALGYAYCAAQAASRGLSLRDLVGLLLIHGLLHLTGEDHADDGEAARMEAAERRIAAALELPDPYPEPTDQTDNPQRMEARR